MKNTELFDILGGIDDKFYDEVLGGDSERPMEIRIKNPAFSIRNVMVPVAACLAVAAGIGVTAHFLNKVDIIDPNITTSDAALANPNITDADIEECKELLRARYPDIDNIISANSYCTVDIDFDGSDELLILASSENSRDLIIFEKTKDGMTESASVPAEHIFYLNDLHKYDADGEQYWYLYRGEIFFNADTGESMNTFYMQRIDHENGEYSIDHPLCYGYTFEDKSDDVPMEWFFKTDAVYREIHDTSSNITPEEFKANWVKHADLPKFKYFATFEEEYPLVSEVNIPTIESAFGSVDDALHGVRLTSADVGEYKVYLTAKTVFKLESDTDPERFHAGSLALYLVKDGKAVSSDGVMFESTVHDGANMFYIDPDDADSFFKIYDLNQYNNYSVLAFGMVNREGYGWESNFFGIKDGKITRLFGNTTAGDVGVSGNVTCFVNAPIELTPYGTDILVDADNHRRYNFSPDVFDCNPFEMPHFTTSVDLPNYVRQANYPKYNGTALSETVLCEKTIYTADIVKLIALNAEPVIVDGVEHVKYSDLFLYYTDEPGWSGNIIPIHISEPDGLIASRLDDYLEVIEFVNDEGYAREVVAVYRSLTEGSAVRDYAVFYNLWRGNGFTRKPSEFNGVLIPSGDPTYLGRDFTLLPNEWAVALDNGDKIVFDHENMQYDLVYPER